MSEFRVEKDSMGEVQVPVEAYFGGQTRRAVENGPVSDAPMPLPVVHAVAMIKGLGAEVNAGLGLLPPNLAESISRAAREVLEGKFDKEFVLDVFQTGSGTSTNMNVNEVLANRANELLGQPKGSYAPVHPNDHVNRCQSSNDVIPSASGSRRADSSPAPSSRPSSGCGTPWQRSRGSSPTS
jgi:fumarate hydratase class II